MNILNRGTIETIRLRHAPPMARSHLANMWRRSARMPLLHSGTHGGRNGNLHLRCSFLCRSHNKRSLHFPFAGFPTDSRRSEVCQPWKFDISRTLESNPPVSHSLRGYVFKIMNRPETRSGRTFAWFVQILILISLVSFSVETLPDLSPSTQAALSITETVTVMLFTAEYVLRIWSANRPLRFVFSFFGLIDLLAILPFYLSTGLDLRGVRALRMMRLFRLLKVARYNRAMKRLLRASSMAREELVLFFSLAMLVLFVSATGIYYFERDAQPERFASVFHALWWAVETLTTVGYGDTFPITLGGRIFTFVVIMCGLGIVGMPAGIMASALTRAANEENERDVDQ